MYGIGNERAPPIVMYSNGHSKGHLSKSLVESVDEQSNDHQSVDQSLVGFYRWCSSCPELQRFVKHEDRCFATWFCSPRRLVQGKNENLSPSAKRLLRLLTLWTPSDHPYLVEVLHSDWLIQLITCL